MKNRFLTPLVQTAAAGALLASASTAMAEDEGWEFGLTPLFLWGVSIDGDATIDGMTAPLDLSFTDDIFENLDAVLTVHFEARKNRWTIFTEFQYLKLDPDGTAGVGPITVEADIEFENYMFELGGGWAFIDGERSRWEVIGGGRYFDQEVEVDLEADLPGPLPGRNRTIKGGDDWAHPFAGLRGFYSFTERWSLIGRLDWGFSGSDNKATNFSTMVDYRFRDWGSVFIGYRYMDIRYDDSSYGFDAIQQGPLAGFSVYW